MASAHNMELFRMKAELVKTLADATRLVIISELLSGEKSVGELAESISIPQPMVSRHLAIMRERGVVNSRREGTTIYYSLSDPRIGEACALVNAILLEQLQKRKEFAERVTP